MGHVLVLQGALALELTPEPALASQLVQDVLEHVGIFKGLHLRDGGSVELMKGLWSREMET